MEGEAIGKLQGVLTGLKRPVTALTFGQGSGDVVAAGDEEGRVCLWKVKKEEGETSEDEASIHITKANLPW